MTLLLPILSCRDKSPTGKGRYVLTNDSNMHCILNLYCSIINNANCELGIPEPSQIADLDEFKELLKHYAPALKLRHFHYGSTIRETRELFSERYPEKLADFVISGIPGVQCDIYLANTSLQLNFNQPCDEFFGKDIKTMEQASTVYVHDFGQYDALPSIIQEKTRFTDKSAICRPAYYDAIEKMKRFEPRHGQRSCFVGDISTYLIVPINITNPEYAFANSVYKLIEKYGRKLLVTNPKDESLITGHLLFDWIDFIYTDKQGFYELFDDGEIAWYPADNRLFHVLGQELKYFGYSLYDAEYSIYAKL